MIDRQELARLVETMQRCNGELAKLGCPPVTAAWMLERYPLLREIEAALPGLLEAIMKAGAGDQEAQRRLDATLDPANHEAAPGRH